MTGKLELGLGEDYAFDPKRAKQYAEGQALLEDSVVVDGGAVPITGSAAGEAYTLSWTSDGTPVSVTHTLVATEAKPETLAALAAAAQANATVSVADSNNEIVVLLSAGTELANGLIARDVGQIGGGLQPGQQDGPNSSLHGADFWIRRSGGMGTVWSVGWDIDADPDPDVWNTLAQFQASSPDPAYEADVLGRAGALGWPG